MSVIDVAERLLIGAVAYDPKVVAVWEGMRKFLREEAGLAAEVVLFLSYEAQIDALLEGRVDVAWNTNLAHLQCEVWSQGACRGLAQRDTDIGWKTVIIALSGGPVKSLADVRGRTLALGSRDSGHAAILPGHFLEEEGLEAGRDFRALRFDTDVGKHGDTGTSETEVLKAVLDGRADAGAVGSPFWEAVLAKDIVPRGALAPVWSSPDYSHCMFTARSGLEPAIADRFTRALYAMDWGRPAHRAVLEAEGLRRWVPPGADGYQSLRDAARRQGFFDRPGSRI